MLYKCGFGSEILQFCEAHHMLFMKAQDFENKMELQGPAFLFMEECSFMMPPKMHVGSCFNDPEGQYDSLLSTSDSPKLS